MRIIRYQHLDQISFGVLEGDAVRQFTGSPFESRTTTSDLLPLEAVQMRAPVAPPNILAIGLNYRQHAIETGAAIPDHPLLFLKATTSVTGHKAPIYLPTEAPHEVDYEAELAIVIGRKARHVTEDKASDYILGYTCANDVSARDCQLTKDSQWARGKSFDSFCPLGPWIETELNPDDCRIESRVNGEIRQQSHTSDLVFDCHKLVSYLSRQMTLPPGTVILTGTPSGVGMASSPPRFLQEGDICEIEIEGLGVLRNPVVPED